MIGTPVPPEKGLTGLVSASLPKENDGLAVNHTQLNVVAISDSVEISQLLLLKRYFNNKKLDSTFELVTFQPNKMNKVMLKNISE